MEAMELWDNSMGSFQRKGLLIIFLWAHMLHTPTLLASPWHTSWPDKMGIICLNIVVPGCSIRLCHNPIFAGKIIELVGFCEVSDYS